MSNHFKESKKISKGLKKEDAQEPVLRSNGYHLRMVGKNWCGYVKSPHPFTY
jgi:hypothetical protein